jgi:sulfur relay (sulfurtransferase) complex TusBCD TusD component (DsrE family)
MKDLIGRSSQSFTGSKEEAVVEEVEEVEAADNVDVDICVCCAMDKGIGDNCLLAKASGCFWESDLIAAVADWVGSGAMKMVV